jgi:hypothetical protein
MTTWFIDPTGGNDASAGTSFATRLKSFTGYSAKTVAAGDSVRVIASAAPTDTGQTATWTDGSKTVTLTTAATADIAQATTAWTAMTNVTTTTSTSRKIGATSSSISPAAAFTTGLAAYFATGTLNLSAYQQVSFWIKMTSGVTSADGDISIALCSDTAGATPVNTISIPQIKSTNQWCCITVNTGSALGSAIQSIGFYVNVDRAAQTFLINNILACKASSSVDSITLSSLISKNTTNEPWWQIDSISGTTISLMQMMNADLSTNQMQGYSGITGSAELYKREPIILPSSLTDSVSTGTTFGSVGWAGTAGSPITISGGWDTTAMSSQTGQTYIASYIGNGYGMYMQAIYNTVSNINLYKFSSSFVTVALNITLTADNMSSTNYAVYIGATGYVNNQNINVTNLLQSTSAAYAINGLSNSTITIVNAVMCYAQVLYISGKNSGIQGTSFLSPYNTITVTNVRRNGTVSGASITNSAIFLNGLQNSTVTIDKAEYNGGPNLGISPTTSAITCNNNVIKFTSSLGNPTVATMPSIYVYNGINNIINLTGVSVSGSNFAVMVDGSSITNIVNGTIAGTTAAIAVYNNAQLRLLNTAYTGTAYSFINASTTVPDSGTIFWQNYNGTANDNRIYYAASVGQIVTDTTTRHTASGVSWKMTLPTTAGVISPTANFPLSLPVATIACNSSTLVTVTIWIYRTSTSATVKLFCAGGQILGVASDISVSAAGSANTWEQLTLTFTPTQQGVVQLQVQTYGTTSASVYVDDFSVSQA